MRKSILSIIICGLIVVSAFAYNVNNYSDLKQYPWMNFTLTPAQRAKALLNKMTIDEKFTMIHGHDGDYQGNVPENTRLGIPSLNLEDGPQGVADGIKGVTCFPAALTVVATFNKTLMYNFSYAIAEEQFGKGTNVGLGPMMNQARVYQDGRNFESFGEDPYLAGEMGYQYITAMQNKSIIACAKHFALNNQEYNRTLTSANADLRATFEIYFPHFQRAVDAQVGSFMCSYNRINDSYACENFNALTLALKRYMGYENWVMSDWGATHSTVESANNGLDQEMPDDTYFGDALRAALLKGEVSIDRINDMVYRILLPMFAIGLFDRNNTGNLTVNVTTPQHVQLSQLLAQAGTVLVKNTNSVLPLNSSNIVNIAVLGDDAQSNPVYAGSGSGSVYADYVITPLMGIQQQFKGQQVVINYAPSKNLSQAIQFAQQANVTLIFAGLVSGEGDDRKNLSLNNADEQLIFTIGQLNLSKVVVVLHVPGPVLMPWINMVQGVLVAFYPGQQDGYAIQNVLFGNFNPYGRLPTTFPINETQIPTPTIPQYPGIDNNANYSEGLLIGYRYYDAMNFTPLFEFGFGLSYTKFLYSNMKVSGYGRNINIRVNITNILNLAGNEVPQLYLQFPTGSGEPPKILKGFDNIYLRPNESQTVWFNLTAQDFQIFNVSQYDFQNYDGSYVFAIGASSRDIRVTAACNIPAGLYLVCKYSNNEDPQMYKQYFSIEAEKIFQQLKEEILQ